MVSLSIRGYYNQSIYTGRYRYLLLAVAGIQMFILTGIVFGWSPLEKELTKQGVFSYLCRDNVNGCEAQTLRLNLVYTLGAFTATGSAFLSGALFDMYGPVATSFVAMVIMILGCVCWYISHLINDNLYILAFALLGIGGPACQVSLIHICNLFPGYSSSVSTFFSGAFVGSTFVFKVFSVLASNYNLEISTLFLYYIIVLVVLFVPGLFLMHSKPYLPLEEYLQVNSGGKINNSDNNNIKENYIVNSTSTNEPDQNQSENQNNNNNQYNNSNSSKNEQKQSLLSSQERTNEKIDDCVETDIKKKSLIGQMLSWQFILLCLFMSLNTLHGVYYIGIVNDLFESKPVYIDAFNYIWNGGVALVPIVGFIMVKSSLAMNCFYVNLSGVLFGVLSSVPIDQVQWVAFLVISFQNVYLWGVFFIYLSEVFGFTNYGKLMGISSIITAIFGLLEYLLVYLTLNVVPYFWINIVLTVCKLPIFLLPYKLWKESKQTKYKIYF